MKNSCVEKINPGMKIGMDCFMMNISAVLELKDMLSLALTYCNFDFIYNSDCYTRFNNPKPAEEYINRDNELLITGSLDSAFHLAYVKYIDDIQKRYSSFTELKLDPSIRFDIDNMKRQYLDNAAPVIFCCDHYHMYDDYKKSTSDILRYHSQSHMATLVDVDRDNGTCQVVDKFFSFAGEAMLSSYMKSTSSEHIEYPSCYIVQINEQSIDSEKERLQILLKENIQSSLSEQVYVNDTLYYKNIKALEMFIADFEEHINSMMKQKGRYAPQFTTKLLKPVRFNKKGFSNLIGYIKQVLSIDALQEIDILCKEIISLWVSYDSLCDKCYLSGSTIVSYTDRLKSLMEAVCEKEKLLFDRLYSLERVL